MGVDVWRKRYSAATTIDQGNNSKKFAISISKSVKRFSFTIVLAKTQANFCHWILRKPRK